MSRVRTGHGPKDWSLPDEGAFARLPGNVFGGELVVAYTAAPPDRKAKAVGGRSPWFGLPKCGGWMPKVGERCGRTLGHTRECRTTTTLEARKQRIRKTVAA